jgi:hypothetical protein
MYRNIPFGLFLLILLNHLPLENITAQNIPGDGAPVISEIIEEALTSNDEGTDPGNIADEMSYFLEHPMNLNTTSAEELRQLHLLTEFQIYALLNYILTEGEMLSVYELQLVYGFDRQLISRLIPFIKLTPDKRTRGNITHLNKRFGQTLIIRTGFDGNIKSGFIPDTSGKAVFAGANRSIMVRYEANISRFSMGFTIDQDAGESFTNDGRHFCPDFMSMHLEYKGIGPVKKIIIGDYKGSWGQGLIFGGYGARKSSQVLITPETTGLKKYCSAGENDYFRGAAVSLGWGHLKLDIFGSHTKTDAGLHYLSADSSGKYFSSPDASGLHRSYAEIEKKDAIISNSFGGHAQFNKGNIECGLTYLNQQFNQQWNRNSTAYIMEIFPAGTQLQNFGSDFKASMGKIAVFSEIAVDTKTRMAVFSGILAELHPLVRLSLVYRNYQPNYLGLRSSGFGESQDTKNEKGFYMGLQLYPWKYLKADLYVDHYSFPFLRYNSTNPYSGNDYLLNLTFYPNREFIINMRFRYEKNQSRSTESLIGIKHMETIQKGSFRLEMNYQVNKNVKLKSRIEFSYFQEAEKSMTKGFYSGHDLNLQTSSQKYKLWIRYAIFDIPSWENRIYAYENDVQYSFSVPAYSSAGTRFIIMGRSDLFPFLELSVRYAVTGFRGIRTWGSGNDEVRSGKDSYWTIQLKFKI